MLSGADIGYSWGRGGGGAQHMSAVGNTGKGKKCKIGVGGGAANPPSAPLDPPQAVQVRYSMFEIVEILMYEIHQSGHVISSIFKSLS